MRGPKHLQTDELPLWAECLHTVVFILAVLAPLLVPAVALAAFGPLAGIGAAVLCCLFYFRVRPRSGGFGPLWLEMVDFFVVITSLSAVGFSIYQAARSLF